AHAPVQNACQPALIRQVTADNNEISQPNKLNGSVADFQNLHRELLLGHKRGLLFGVKPELKRVMEQRRGKIHKEEEQARLGPSDLETELRKRQQKLKEVSNQQENQEKIPEFVRAPSPQWPYCCSTRAAGLLLSADVEISFL
uniref:Uncharacterized protein n=1 Tax=Periophthalmus magnuspinnatus TaxID=409849 RepID=A0A3B4A8W3_9GOBI